MKREIETAIVAAGLLCSSPAVAAQVKVSNAWFRALPSGLPAGGYFSLHNEGAEVRLTGARSAACGMLMLHKSAVASGMAEMMAVASVDVPAGGDIAFSPGGYHLMCTGPTPAMAPGGHVPVMLTFNDGTSTNVVFAVRNANGK
ncbi:MAG TPA: copper chaperone PCu(A)C [Rhizomicrobium sp.]